MEAKTPQHQSCSPQEVEGFLSLADGAGLSGDMLEERSLRTERWRKEEGG